MVFDKDVLQQEEFYNYLSWPCCLELVLIPCQFERSVPPVPFLISSCLEINVQTMSRCQKGEAVTTSLYNWSDLCVGMMAPMHAAFPDAVVSSAQLNDI